MGSLPIPVQQIVSRPIRVEQQRPPRTTLLHLPNELLLQVIRHLDQDRDALAQLVRVCRLLWRLAVPVLYLRVTVKPGMLMSFVVTVSRYPRLLLRIQSLTVDDHNTIDSSQAEYLELVVARLENLRVLIIKGQYTQFSWVPQDLVIRHSRLYVMSLQSPSLGKLQECTLSLGQGDPWDMAGRECIFVHPSLRKLTIIGAQMSNFHSFTERITHTSPLQSLILYCCDLSPATLQKILSVPRNLRVLTYGGARQVGDPLYTSPRPHEYIEAMHVQAGSLKIIVFHPWNFKPSQSRAITFRRFTSLLSLTFMPFCVPTRDTPPIYVNLTPLVDSSLPASLITLTILHRACKGISGLENMMKRQLAPIFHAGYLPNMRQVTFFVPMHAITPNGIPDLPLDWDLYFRGRVRAKRRTYQVIQHQPLDCECCDIDMFKTVVDNRVIELTPLTPGFPEWLFNQLRR